MSKFLHITEEEVELCIQTLENVHLIDIKKIDQTYIANINAEQVDKYFKIPISKIAEGNGIPMATEIKWNVEEKSNDFELASMSDDQLERMIKELQRRKEEKKKGCQVVYPSGFTEQELLDQLPF